MGNSFSKVAPQTTRSLPQSELGEPLDCLGVENFYNLRTTPCLHASCLRMIIPWFARGSGYCSKKTDFRLCLKPRMDKKLFAR